MLTQNPRVSGHMIYFMEYSPTHNMANFFEKLGRAAALGAVLSGVPADKAEAASGTKQPTCNIETVAQEGQTVQEKYEAIVQRIAEDPMRFGIGLLGKHITLTQQAQQPQVDRWNSVGAPKEVRKQVFDEANLATDVGLGVVTDFTLTEETVSAFHQKEGDRFNQLQEEMKEMQKIQEKLAQVRTQQPINAKDVAKLEDDLILHKSAVSALTGTLARALQRACDTPPTSR